MKNIVLFDLDGTLARVDHRLYLVKHDDPNWKIFNEHCSLDEINDWCKTMVEVFQKSGFRVMIVTARNKAVERQTLWWMAEKEIDPSIEVVFVRSKVGDIGKDADVKRMWLQQSGLKDQILFVVDDRTRVVDMWRSEGLVCLQCNKWDEFGK